MSEIKLFEIGATTKELTASTVGLEKELQTIIENNMEKFFGVKFLKSEYVISAAWTVLALMKTIVPLFLNINAT